MNKCAKSQIILGLNGVIEELLLPLHNKTE